ncbi:MAG: hypothetical protein IPL40_07845 [Proteobacteria bacterium]|nr:hypothetical protein [Pseudomonadota bacterium]
MAASTLLIAVGNVLRGDDGVAAAVLDQLGARADLQSIAVPGLTPELAETIAAARVVVILDADVAASDVTLEPLLATPLRRGEGHLLSHDLSPAILIALARQLYGFTGAAWLCRLPARAFPYGAELSGFACAAVREGALQLVALLGRLERAATESARTES